MNANVCRSHSAAIRSRSHGSGSHLGRSACTVTHIHIQQYRTALDLLEKDHKPFVISALNFVVTWLKAIVLSTLQTGEFFGAASLTGSGPSMLQSLMSRAAPLHLMNYTILDNIAQEFIRHVRHRISASEMHRHRTA